MGGGGHWHGRRPTSVSEDGDGVLDGGTAVTGAGKATPGSDLARVRSVCPSVKPPYRGIRAADWMGQGSLSKMAKAVRGLKR
jgi:hypothetical protein